MSDRLVELCPVAGPEVTASCGCVFVVAAERLIDPRSGAFQVCSTLVVVPCGEEHLALARDIGERHCGQVADALMLGDLLAEFEGRLRLE